MNDDGVATTVADTGVVEIADRAGELVNATLRRRGRQFEPTLRFSSRIDLG